jgi:hypothetical protein
MDGDDIGFWRLRLKWWRECQDLSQIFGTGPHYKKLRPVSALLCNFTSK